MTTKVGVSLKDYNYTCQITYEYIGDKQFIN